MNESDTTRAFKTRVLEVLAAIPEGRVMTYGSLAVAAGKPGNARQVGDLLRGLSSATAFPWQRVINSQGRISTYKIGTGELQRALLESEGIAFSDSGRCDLERLNWFPGDDAAPPS
jgi:methylated-DNA-protein-cysteine methyltransferase related protein